MCSITPFACFPFSLLLLPHHPLFDHHCRITTYYCPGFYILENASSGSNHSTFADSNPHTHEGTSCHPSTFIYGYWCCNQVMQWICDIMTCSTQICALRYSCISANYNLIHIIAIDITCQTTILLHNQVDRIIHLDLRIDIGSRM